MSRNAQYPELRSQIAALIEGNEEPTSTSEIREKFPEPSVPTLNYHLKALKTDGVIESVGRGLYAYLGEKRRARRKRPSTPGSEGSVRGPWIGPFGIGPA